MQYCIYYRPRRDHGSKVTFSHYTPNSRDRRQPEVGSGYQYHSPSTKIPSTDVHNIEDSSHGVVLSAGTTYNTHRYSSDVFEEDLPGLESTVLTSIINTGTDEMDGCLISIYSIAGSR